MRLPFVLLLALPLAACSGDASDLADPVPSVSAGPSTAAPTATASPRPTPTPTTVAPATVAPATVAPAARPSAVPAVRLIGDGVDLPSQVVVFGTPYDAARQAFDTALGAPTTDTGRIDPFSVYGACPGDDLRVLEYSGGSLRLFFGTVDGPATTFYGWALSRDGRPDQVPQASALIGDQATFTFGIGTTVATLQEGLGQTLTVNEGDEMFGPSFRVADQSGGFFGFLESTAPAGQVDGVQAGDACGE